MIAGLFNIPNPNTNPSIPDGKYFVHSTVDEKYVWDMDMNSGNLLLWPKHGRKNQQFIFKYKGNGIYLITSVASGKVLENQWGRTNNGANVGSNDFSDSQNQHWIIVRKDTLFSKNLITVYPEIGYFNLRRCIDLTWANASTGVNIWLYQENGSKAQIWHLEPVS